MYDDDHAKWTTQNKRYTAWKAAGSKGLCKDFEETKKELTKAQKKAALQAQIDALS